MSELSAASKDRHATCFHCDLPLPGEIISAEVSGREQRFCCYACRAVAQLIDGSGLGQYYTYRDAAPQATPPPERNSAFAIYQNAEIQQTFVSQQDDGCSEARLIIEGIHCSACTWLIEHYLQQQSGVVKASVNSVSHQCNVQWQSDANDIPSIMSAIATLGYQPKPATHSQQQQSLREENRRALMRLGVAGFGMMQAGMFAVALYAGGLQDMSEHWRNLFRWISLLIATPVIFYSAQPFFLGAWRALKFRHLSMDVPVAIALALAYSASCWATVSNSGEVYFDSVSMFTFFLLVGRYMEMRLRHKNLLSIHYLMSALPNHVTRVGLNGDEEVVTLAQIKAGDYLLVKEGDTIAADGVVAKGEANINEAMLTGESTPVWKRLGDDLIAGSICEENSLLVEVRQVGDNTRLSAMQRAMERALSDKSQQLERSDKLAVWFVARVLIIASITATVWLFIDPAKALWVTLSVLVVTCPCALSLAMPVALTAAIYRLRQLGLLVTRGHVLEALAKVTTVVFDKTGTVTDGEFQLQSVKVYGEWNEQQAVAIAAALERNSRHPLASAFRDAASPAVNGEDFASVVGQGVSATINGRHYRLGREQFARGLAADDQCSVPSIQEPSTQQPTRQQPTTQQRSSATQLWLGDDDKLIACFELTDKLRPEAAGTMSALSSLHLKTMLLSGDNAERVQTVARTLGVDAQQANSLPEQKLALIRQRQAAGETVLMVGDGLNDLPVLAGADVSMAMATATDFTRINADSVLLGNKLTVVPTAIACARACQRIIRQNWSWALGYNAVALPFAVAGLVPPYLAAAGMSLSSLIVVLNGMRLNRFTWEGASTVHSPVAGVPDGKSLSVDSLGAAGGGRRRAAADVGD